MALAVDPHRRLVEVAEHDSLGDIARDGRVPRVDCVTETDRDGR